MAQQTRADVTVAAGRPEVMAVIADFPSYPDWANVQSAEVLSTGADGRAERVRFALDAGPIRDSYVLGYTWSGDDGVSWHIDEPGRTLTAMDGSYTLAERAGGTVVTFELAVDVKIPMIGPLKRKAEKMLVDTALQGLKKRVEG